MATTADTPERALDALVGEHHLNLGRIALLTKMKNSIIDGVVGDYYECVKALWAVYAPIGEVTKRLNEADTASIEWADKNNLMFPEFKEKMQSLANEIIEFWTMLPRPSEEDKKKVSDTETDSSQN